MKTKTKHTAELVAERLAKQLDEEKRRCAALVEAINVTGARDPSKDVTLETILAYAAGFYGWMTADAGQLQRSLH